MQIQLSEKYEDYVATQIATGHYANAGEVVQEALHLHQKQEQRHGELKAAVAIGAQQAEQGLFVDQSVDEIFAEAEKEYGAA